jgi:hypothetical protein
MYHVCIITEFLVKTGPRDRPYLYDFTVFLEMLAQVYEISISAHEHPFIELFDIYHAIYTDSQILVCTLVDPLALSAIPYHSLLDIQLVIERLQEALKLVRFSVRGTYDVGMEPHDIIPGFSEMIPNLKEIDPFIDIFSREK